MTKPLNLKKPFVFRGRPERKDVRLIARIAANTAPLVFAYTEGPYEHVTQRPENGKVGFIDDKDDIINVVEKRQTFRVVSRITGNFSAECSTLEQARLNWGAVPHLGYVITDFEDNYPMNVVFVKNEALL